MPSQPSPNVLNYYVGKGTVVFTPDGGGPLTLGNAPKFEFDPKNTRLPHYSSQVGIKFKDFEVVQVKEPEFTLMLDEWTLDNLSIALMGSLSGSTMQIMDQAQVSGQLVFTGTNLVGPKKRVTLPKMAIFPTGKLGFIDDGYGQIEIVGPVYGDPNTGSFGTIEDI